VKQLIHLMCKYPTLKRAIIINQKKVFAVVSRDDILVFLLANETEFEEEMRRPIENVKCNCTQIQENKNQAMCCAFQVMWEKQIVGKLASSRGSSSMDLFFNWLHYVHSALNLISCEPAYILEATTVKEAIEHILRENISELFVVDSKTKCTIGMITVSDLIKLFC